MAQPVSRVSFLSSFADLVRRQRDVIGLAWMQLVRKSSDVPAAVHISHDGLQAHVSEVELSCVGAPRQSISAKFMKDSVVRGRLLQLLYERRNEGSIPFGRLEEAVPPPGGISRRDWLRAVAQLSEYGLIEWTPLEDKSGMGLLSGFAKINDFGVKVFEAGVEPPIRIAIDKSRRTTVPKQEQAPIAPSTPQQQMITDALEKVITAINQADVSEQEKNEAKSLLRKLLSSKAATKVLGAGAQSLAAKHFAG
jgi:hypothetical protein